MSIEMQQLNTEIITKLRRTLKKTQRDILKLKQKNKQLNSELQKYKFKTNGNNKGIFLI
jgi:hypothetical protein